MSANGQMTEYLYYKLGAFERDIEALKSQEVGAGGGGSSTLTVVNNSGGAVAAGDVVLLQYDGTDGLEAVTTATASTIGAWAVVETGAADGSDITVYRSGTGITVAYAGGAPSAGDFLVTSTTAGSAAGQAYCSPAIFAVCTANGAGGTVEATLLTQRVRIPASSPNEIVSIINSGNWATAGWLGTVNDAAPTTSPVTVATSTGNINMITPSASGQEGKIVMRNTTRGTEAYIDSISGNNITFHDDADLAGWVNGDNLSCVSAAVTGAGNLFREIYLPAGNAIPDLAVEVGTFLLFLDSGAAGIYLNLHPYETYAQPQKRTVGTQVANRFFMAFTSSPIIDRKFCINNGASGAATCHLYIRLNWYLLAAP